jgi:hypothetical protein
MAKLSITLPDEMREELAIYQQVHLEFNLSGWFQKKIKELLEANPNEQKD